MSVVDAELVDEMSTSDDALSAEGKQFSMVEVDSKLYPYNGAAYNPYASFVPTFEGTPTGVMSTTPIVPLKPMHVDIDYNMGLRDELVKKIKEVDMQIAQQVQARMKAAAARNQ